MASILRIAVIGTGRMGAGHIKRLTYRLIGADVTGVVDINAERAKATAREIVDVESGLGYRLIQVGFMCRYDAGYQRLRAFFEDGLLGVLPMLHYLHR